MIITHPTGLYKTVLPQGTESGNITYTISSQDPPRQFVNASQIPIIEELTPAPDKIFDDATRREQFGELVFTTANSNRNVVSTNTKAFEVGEQLSFENLVPVEEIITTRAPEDISIQHNTNLLDLEGLGLTEEEIQSLELQSAAKQADLEEMFVSKQSELKQLEANIREIQKAINENQKTLKAVRELLGIQDNETSDNTVFQKLIQNEAMFRTQLEDTIASRNEVSVEIADINQSINRIAELVR